MEGSGATYTKIPKVVASAANQPILIASLNRKATIVPHSRPKHAVEPATKKASTISLIQGRASSQELLDPSTAIQTRNAMVCLCVSCVINMVNYIDPTDRWQYIYQRSPVELVDVLVSPIHIHAD